ncbi:MAG TPA: YebC/PmpR family DNA-binding transcriptional regulator [Spirochaetota bacterium]|nr:YebC/PmpR family DNA-binding transcriptional regulator [Spirochaetota bacterium]
MSGHSKWASIKHKKGALDAKRGKLFSKLIKEITVAVKQGGADTEANPRLRTAVLKAKDANMPSKNIESAVKKASGNDSSENYEEITYEGYGPEGVAIFINCLTDNIKRTVADIRATLSKHGGNLGENGSVAWQFEKKGIINIEKDQVKNEDELMEIALEAGAEDVIAQTEGFTVKTDPEQFYNITGVLKNKNIAMVNAEITMDPKNCITLTPDKAEKIEKLINALEDLDDIQSVSSNEEIAE